MVARGCMVGRGACMVGRGHVWQRGVHGEEGHAWYTPPPTPHEIPPVIARAVRILLECILVKNYF